MATVTNLSLEEIKAATIAGHVVYWASRNYVVIRDVIKNTNGDATVQWLIKCLSNDHCIGLTWADGVTVNGTPDQFFFEGDISTTLKKD